MAIAFDSAIDSRSYWHATENTLIPDDDFPRSAEVVIVGGGMLGCWTAYWLAKAGVKPVVLERKAIGWGATGRNGGFLVGGATLGYASLINMLGRSEAKTLQELTRTGQQLAKTMIAEEELACDWQNNGTLSIALNENELIAMQESLHLLREDGFTGEVLDRQGVQDRVLTPLAPEIVGGRFSDEDGTLHSVRYLAGLARAAKNYGARFVNATVDHITDTAVVTNQGKISAGNVIVALNAWTADLLPELSGIIVPTRGQILAYEPIEPVFTSAVGAEITPTGEYWQQTPDGHIVIGGCRADAPHKDSNVRKMVPTQHVIDSISSVLPRLFPELSILRIKQTWAGLMAFTADNLPIVDRATNGAWYGGGFNGHGMPFGPVIGKALSEAVLSGKLPSQVNSLRRERPGLFAV